MNFFLKKKKNSCYMIFLLIVAFWNPLSTLEIKDLRKVKYTFISVESSQNGKTRMLII